MKRTLHFLLTLFISTGALLGATKSSNPWPYMSVTILVWTIFAWRYPNIDTMANLCSNSVVFSGDPSAIENAKALFNEIQNGVFENKTQYIEKMIQDKKAESPYFKTAGNITRKELDRLYGEMTQADLVLKFAEHKNFEKAREIFQTIDHDTLNQIDANLNETRHYGREQFSTDDKYIAMAYLKQLITEWNDRPPSF